MTGPTRLKRLSVWLAATVTALTVLASCWLPEQFETEIRFTSTGAYGVTYIGVITYAPLFGKIARGEISKEDVDRQIQQYLTFLKGYWLLGLLGFLLPILWLIGAVLPAKHGSRYEIRAARRTELMMEQMTR